jgi:phosphoketolase
VVSKQQIPGFFTSSQAQQLVETGAITLSGDETSKVLLVAVGSYQLIEALRASDRLKEHGIPHNVIYLFEPGKFRSPRDSREAAHTNPPEVRESLFPPDAKARVFLTHTRPEVLLSVVRPIDTGGNHTRGLGYINRGGTFNVQGMLFANRCTWAHAVAAVAEGVGRETKELLSKEELKAIHGETNPIPVLFQKG